MAKYVLYRELVESVRPSAVASPEAAAKVVLAEGAAVVGQSAGTLIIDADADQAERVLHQLPGWSCTPESRAFRIPRPPRIHPR
ncbi:hypothetical protein OOT46_25175 [Aquabacterium sp. A7-Y]|uniref:hypothetical protein n=1 Tax=Aquabacterium sp. A7-Y TaxID=1349605 RepID=UPI00223CBFF3|nr:hypothetical protein [Aquabacterium sp. A7-Y]MCW7541111.1 hypothetical protein [Aquabacterium sp. A7-Y]